MTPLLTHRPKPVDRAFERLYRRHVHDVYRYTVAVMRNEADAEDVTQSTFLSAYRAFTKGERPVKPHNWLIKIAHNECRQRFRASARRPQEVALQETDGQARPALDDDVPTAEEIREALGHLSFNQRAALVMRELEGRSYAEIATILETSVSAIETLLFRARRALREQLEGSLTCGQAELTLARRLDGTITQAERGPLRAHLRECKECASLERRQRAHRSALKTSLGAVPLPVSLQSFFGGGAATVGGTLAGTGLAGKLAAVMAAGAVVAGAGQQAVQAIDAKPKGKRTDVVAESSTPTGTPVARAQSAIGTSRRTPAAAKQRSKIGPVGSAHRRTLRPSGVEAAEPVAAAHTSPPATPAAAPSSPAAVSVKPPATLPPAPLPLPEVELPKVELPPLPQLPPLPPPPPVELPKLPLLPPPPPLPQLPPVPPLPQLPPPPPLPLSK
jgi:RNA polymerase sigma factor (sigma-70 family)